MFEKEIEFYEKRKDELLRHHENQYVVLKGNRIVGAFSSEREAYEAALKELGNVSFLIKHVTKEEEVIRFPALAISSGLRKPGAHT